MYTEACARMGWGIDRGCKWITDHLFQRDRMTNATKIFYVDRHGTINIVMLPNGEINVQGEDQLGHQQVNSSEHVVMLHGTRPVDQFTLQRRL